VGLERSVLACLGVGGTEPAAAERAGREDVDWPWPICLLSTAPPRPGLAFLLPRVCIALSPINPLRAETARRTPAVNGVLIKNPIRDIATAALSGNLTLDVELRELPSGVEVARLRAATTTRRRHGE
jgi:hypothetical protein